MVWLEEKIRPPGAAPPRIRDALGLGLLVALGVALLPALGLDLGLLVSAMRGGDGARQQVADVITRRTNDVAAWYLLPALGFAVALRRGAVDLSVWAAAGVGGLVAAAALRADLGPGWALAAALAAGLAVGAVNGALVAGARIPSVFVTVVTGLALIWASGVFVGPGKRSVSLPEHAFDTWRMTKTVLVGSAPATNPASSRPQARSAPVTSEVWLPLRVTRMTVVGVIFSATVLVLLVLMAKEFGQPDSRVRGKLFAALCVSGGLAGMGGMCWLLDQPHSAPVPTRLVDDLRIPVAAILAGAVFLGRRRTALCALCLPFALVLVTAWRQEVWHLHARGYALQVAMLGGMILVSHMSFAHACGRSARPRWLASTAATLIVAGLLLVAATVHCETYSQQRLLQHAGLGLWLGGAAMLILSRILSRRALA